MSKDRSSSLAWFKLTVVAVFCLVTAYWFGQDVYAQLIDRTKNPNTINAGIAKSLSQQTGAGRGDMTTPDSSMFIIKRDPFRSIRRGRQLFQRKFLRTQGAGPIADDLILGGNIETSLKIGAGLADSCAACHGRPRGSAGFGGDVVTRPESRDAPHLFGLGLKEMLADEITADLRAIRANAITQARHQNRSITRHLRSKGIEYGRITARPNGTVDTSDVSGINTDLRVKPFFHHGGTISIREFIVGAFNDEMGLQAVDPDLEQAHNGGRIETPSGMVLDGSKDQISGPLVADASQDEDGDGIANEIPTSVVDHMEFYLLNYFKAGTHRQSNATRRGLETFRQVGCAQCHIPDLVIDHDRRVADVETVYDESRGNFNNLFATATPLFSLVPDNSGYPEYKRPLGGIFRVENIFTDFKRHDLGPNFHERNYDGTYQRLFMTTPLWGVGSTGPYGHDGRSVHLLDVILRHGGEAQWSRDQFASRNRNKQQEVLDFLNSLILFPPDDTASNLDPGDRNAPMFPQYGQGSIKLGVLFNNPNDPE
ncbi:MAG: thiol oxidoreductase-like protein [Acidobacteria bacterium]|nr:thiol oxidoreductase-like protein [Acidobacteriota bacterium]